MLDLAGYTADQPLHRRCLLEPSCGQGVFLLAALERLWTAFQRAGGTPDTVSSLRDALCGVEIREDVCQNLRLKMATWLIERGCSARSAALLTQQWIRCGDFLLLPEVASADVVIGNPPYVRQEEIGAERLSLYRSRYATMRERADLYVPFYERGLSLLKEEGKIVFLCTDRWLKNRYGGALRAWMRREWALDVVVGVEGDQVFETEVLSYPAITCIRRGRDQGTKVAVCRDVRHLSGLLQQLSAQVPVVRPAPPSGAGPVLLSESQPRRIIEALEERFPALEQAGCTVGIGVATGADNVFIGPMDALPVEASRRLPLLMTGDVRGGQIRWGGQGLVNPFLPNGELVCLLEFPNHSGVRRCRPLCCPLTSTRCSLRRYRNSGRAEQVV
jgi:Eco57I restriction-modification methylase